jgi:hypothetical protein
MRIIFDIQLTDEEQNKLTRVLGCDSGKLAEVLKAHGSSALDEYIQMYLGRPSLRFAADAREVRLVTLIKHVFDGSIPDEHTVSRLFHLTAAQSRSLIRSVLAKYQLELDDGIQSLYVKALKDGKRRQTDDSYEIDVRNSAVVDGLNQALMTMDGRLPRIAKKTGTVGVFVIDVASYQKLCEKFGVRSDG